MTLHNTLAVKSAVAMDSGAYAYDTNSTFQRLVYDKVQAWLPDLRGRDKLTVVDYGCGPGHNWIHSIATLLSNADSNVECQLVLNDGVQNDWNAVARIINGAHAEQCVGKKGHIVMLPGSFYEQVMPSCSVDVGMAWSSFHWLENKPPHVSPARDQEFYETWRASVRSQGRDDLTKLLRVRAREVKPGGHFLLVLPTVVDSAGNLHFEATLLALQSCVKDGLMTDEQYRAFSPPIFQPSKEDLLQLLGCVGDLWSLPVPLGRVTVTHLAWDKLQESGKADEDYEQYAESIAGFMLGIFSGVLVGTLRDGLRKEDGQQVAADDALFLEEFKSRFKKALLSDSLRNRPAQGDWFVMQLVRRTL